MGWWEQQVRSQGAALVPDPAAHQIESRLSEIRKDPLCTGAAQRSRANSPERCPSDQPCSQLVFRRSHHAAPASVCPSPLPSCPSTPSPSVCKSCYLSQLPPPPSRRLPCTPIHSTHDLVLSYSGKRRAPLALRPPLRPMQHPWVQPSVALSPPGRSP